MAMNMQSAATTTITANPHYHHRHYHHHSLRSGRLQCSAICQKSVFLRSPTSHKAFKWKNVSHVVHEIKLPFFFGFSFKKSLCWLSACLKSLRFQKKNMLVLFVIHFVLNLKAMLSRTRLHGTSFNIEAIYFLMEL